MPIEWEPYKVAPTQAGQSVAGAMTASEGEEETPASYIAKSAVVGATDQLRRNVEAGLSYNPVKAAMDPLGGVTEAMARTFLPSEWVNKIYPPTEGAKEKAEALIPKGGRKYTGEFSDFLRADRGEAPGVASRIVGAGAEAFGATVAMPLGAPAKLGRATLMALGSGMGGEAGRDMGGGFGATIGKLWDEFAGTKGGEEVGRTAGEVTGNIAGGGVGAGLNVTRGKAVGAVGQAAVSAIRLRKEADRKTLLDNFKDEYSALHAESQGVVQQHVNERLAAAMGKNPEVKQNITDFEMAAERAGIDPNTFDLAQKTNDPSLIVAYRTQQPKDLKEATEEVARAQKQRSSIVTALEKATGSSPSAKEVVDSLNEVRKDTNVRIAAIDAAKKSTQDALPHYTPETKAEAGEGLARAYEAKKEEARPVRDSWYQQARTADTLDPKTYNLKEVRKQVGSILDSTLARLSPDTTPESFFKLDKLLKRAEGVAEKTERVEKKPGLFETVKTPGVKPEPITYSDMEDMFKSLNRETPKDPTEARNLSLVSDALYKAFSDQAPKAVKDAFDTAQNNYKTLYVPMFKEGVNNNLDRMAGVGRKGESFYAPDHGLDPYLKKDELVTRMQQFDNLFGGQLIGKRDEGAYKELGKALSDRYYKDMFQGGKYTQAKHDQFMREYDPAFKRSPETKDLITKQAAKVFDFESQIDREKATFKEAINSPLNETIGKKKADELVSGALADPRKMNVLVNSMKEHGGPDALLKDVTNRFNLTTQGAFDPVKMEKVLNSGKEGLLTLFEAKLGSPEAAKDHFDKLQSISLLAKRHSLMNEKMLPPSERMSTDPIYSKTGSSGASLMSYYRSVSQGYTSLPYTAVLAGGRFLNKTFQNALADAEKKAFNDPAMANAVLELYQKQEGEKITMKTAKTLTRAGGDMGSKLLDWLIDRDFVKQTVGKGAQLGATQYAEDEEKKHERPSD